MKNLSYCKITLAALGLLVSLNTRAEVKENILVEGTFGTIEGCDLALKGVISDTGEKVLLCTYNTKNAKFTNGASKAALTNGGLYYVVGLLADADNAFIVTEVARIGE